MRTRRPSLPKATVAAGLRRQKARGDDPAGTNFICVNCGTQFAASAKEPAHCPICEDERQYVADGGQRWTTLADYRRTHKNVFAGHEPNLYTIRPQPKAGIGQRAFLVCTGDGNLLWDCVTHLDAVTVRRVNDLGGLRAIAVSHPHFYTTMVEWSRAFGDVPIHLHQDNAKWVMRPDERIQYWTGETKPLFSGLTLARTGGHFDGFQVLHWPGGADGRGVLLAGDQPDVCADRRWVTFMYSYPNTIPLGPTAIRRIVASLKPFAFDRLYSAFAGQVVQEDAKAAVARSAKRYLRAISA